MMVAIEHIEQALVVGEMTVGKVPKIWNKKDDEYLGITPNSLATGPL